MHPPMSSSPNDAAYWRQQVDQWQASGLSQTQYCKTHQLTYHRFIYWRQKIESVEGSQAAVFFKVVVTVFSYSKLPSLLLAQAYPGSRILP